MTDTFALEGKRIVTPQEIISGHIVIEAGKIQTVGQGHAPTGLKVTDADDNLVVPGFIDLHIHGAGGWDTSTPQSTLNMARTLADNGVTAFYPTPATTEMQAFLDQLQAVGEAVAEQRCHPGEAGAEILGLHLEGPFLNREKKGAMPEEYLLEPSIALLNQFETHAPGLIKRITVAPELPGGLAFVAELRQRGYVVAGGHTTANAEMMSRGIDAGITVANHLYNAMPGLHHREPGVLGVYLTDDRVVCEIIADGIHVLPLAIEIALRCKGQHNLYLISDAIKAAGLPPGNYEFLNRRISIDATGISRQQDGTIAGSTCLLPIGFRTIVEMGHSPILAARLTSTNPARVADVLDCKGTLEVGKDADITVLDENYRVTGCCIRGTWHKTPATAGTSTGVAVDICTPK